MVGLGDTIENEMLADAVFLIAFTNVLTLLPLVRVLA